jgi:hypothetical protein
MAAPPIGVGHSTRSCCIQGSGVAMNIGDNRRLQRLLSFDLNLQNLGENHHQNNHRYGNHGDGA